MKYVPSSAARTAKAALVLCVFDEEDAWSAPPRANDGDDKFEHENDISAFSFASQRRVFCAFEVVWLRARSREFLLRSRIQRRFFEREEHATKPSIM